MALALWFALIETRLERLLAAVLYIASSEVFWRMSGVVAVWEFGKYAVILILGLGLLRFFRLKAGIGLPVLYGALLLPAVFMTIESVGSLGAARDPIVFNLLGPAALVIAAVFFRQGVYGWSDLRAALWMGIGPIASIATLALYSTLEAGTITFTGESNFVTSGGFGPNQVSTALSFGALMCVFIAMRETNLRLRLLALTTCVWFVAQDMLTFSRGGVVAFGVALMLGSTQYIRQRRRRLQTLFLLAIGLFVVIFLVLPRLDTFTGNKLGARLSDRGTTGRTELMLKDLRIWKDHWLLGVGPGMSVAERASSEGEQEISTHTEFTRLLADHGIPGLVALALLLVMAIRAFRRAPPGPSRAWVAALAAWSLIGMANSATRVVLIPLAFGLMMLTWVSEAPERDSLSSVRAS
jgi:hypothetical protein